MVAYNLDWGLMTSLEINRNNYILSYQIRYFYCSTNQAGENNIVQSQHN